MRGVADRMVGIKDENHYSNEKNIITELNRLAAQDDNSREKNFFVYRENEIHNRFNYDFIETTTFSGPMEVVHFVDRFEMKQAKESRFSLIRRNLHCHEKEPAASFDFGKKYNSMIRTGSIEAEDKLVSCLYSPPDNQNFTIIGFFNGHFEIRDTETLKWVLFEFDIPTIGHNFISAFNFSCDKYANLNIAFDDFSNYNLILKWDYEMRCEGALDESHGIECRKENC